MGLIELEATGIDREDIDFYFWVYDGNGSVEKTYSLDAKQSTARSIGRGSRLEILNFDEVQQECLRAVEQEGRMNWVEHFQMTLKFLVAYHGTEYPGSVVFHTGDDFETVFDNNCPMEVGIKGDFLLR